MRITGSLLLIPFLFLVAACQVTQGEGAEPVGVPIIEDGLTEHVHRKADPKRPIQVAELGWLAGRWVGEGLGGQCEEMWSAPLAGEMVGTFRLINDSGQADFYELMTMKQLGDRVALRLVHFSVDLKPWEEPGETTDFHLIETSGTTAWFGGLTLHREGDHLLVYIAMRMNGGDMREMELRMKRD
ncbi:MAG: DUF6265 family protein [Planctomycetota bacterium]|nr:DUF6265 family protein [Planctomycetota bacterium]